MFGLPLETSLVVFGAPIFWIVYTIIFLYKSRDWVADESSDDVDDRRSNL